MTISACRCSPNPQRRPGGGDGADIKGEIETAIRDADAYYAVTVESAPADHPNEYHDLHVQVDKPGVQVRTTAGYYANVQH